MIVEHPLLSDRVTRRSIYLDSSRRYLTDDLTPARLQSIIRDIDNGDIAAMLELNEEMEAKDAMLLNVASRRREALTALEWRIEADSDAPDPAEAEKVANYCRRQLGTITAWPLALEHLAEAIGPGISVVENVWWRGRLVDVIPVPGHRLQGSFYDGGGVYLDTDEQGYGGVKCEPPKFIVYTPNSRAGFPLRVTLTRAQAILWVIKRFCMADWTAFSEVYGQPVRVARYDKEPSPSERTDIENMLKNMGTDSWAMFPKSVELEMLEAARSSQPYQALMEWCETRQQILYLGQTLTTEPGNVGSLALGRVHENVRTSITISDINKEARMVREQVLKPMVRFRFPDRAVPVPFFKRGIVEQATIDADTLMLDKLRYMDERRLPVDDEYVYEALGIPRPMQPGRNGPGAGLEGSDI